MAVPATLEPHVPVSFPRLIDAWELWRYHYTRACRVSGGRGGGGGLTGSVILGP